MEAFKVAIIIVEILDDDENRREGDDISKYELLAESRHTRGTIFQDI